MAKPKRRPGRRHNAAGRSDDRERFLPISYQMAESSAWRGLSGAATKVYVELRHRYNGHNNGNLTLALDEAARLLGLGKATVARALVELQTKGFVVRTRKGEWYGRRASEWAVADRPLDGHLATNAWRQWKPAGRAGVAGDGKSQSRFPAGPYRTLDQSASEPSSDFMVRDSTGRDLSDTSDRSAREPPLHTMGRGESSDSSDDSTPAPPATTAGAAPARWPAGGARTDDTHAMKPIGLVAGDVLDNIATAARAALLKSRR